MLQSTHTPSRPSESTDVHKPHLDQVLSVPHQPRVPVSPPGVVIGHLVRLDDDGTPLIDFDGNPSDAPRPARSTVVVTTDDTGRDVALMFELADQRKPIIMGVIQPPQPVARDADLPAVADVDDDRLELSAEREVVLRCGKASITLTRAGKVLIRGAYVSSRASGANRIKGGSVQIN